LETLRLLFELRFFFGKGKLFVHISDETGVGDATNSGHEISNLSRVLNGVNLPWSVIGFSPFVFGHPSNVSAEVIGKKEILLQEEQIGVNVEKAESDCSSTQRFKSKGHEKALRK
jgi:hypothetical protein